MDFFWRPLLCAGLVVKPKLFGSVAEVFILRNIGCFGVELEGSVFSSNDLLLGLKKTGTLANSKSFSSSSCWNTCVSLGGIDTGVRFLGGVEILME